MAKQAIGYSYLGLGGGLQMEAAVKLALDQEDTALVTVFERSRDRVEQLRQRFGRSNPRVRIAVMDVVGNDDDLREQMRNHHVVMCATTYEHNVRFTRLAIEAGTDMCDLGGFDAVVREQLKLDAMANMNGVRFAPACGIAPGACGILLRAAIDDLGDSKATHARVYCGGLPQDPQGALKYAVVFSVRGLIGNYVEDVTEIREGVVVTGKSMSRIGRQDFSGLGLGTLETCATSGALVMATDTFKGRLDSLSYETLRYPGHWQIIKSLRDVGMFDEDEYASVVIGGTEITPRMFTERHLGRILPKDQPDLLVMRVFVKGDKTMEFVNYDLLVKRDPKTGLSAMQQTTGYSMFIVARMMAKGTIGKCGAILHERDIPPTPFLEAWERCGIKVSKSLSAS